MEIAQLVIVGIIVGSFIGLVGMRAPAEQLKAVWESLQRPWAGINTLGRFTAGDDGVDTTEKPAKPQLYVVDSERPR